MTPEFWAWLGISVFLAGLALTIKYGDFSDGSWPLKPIPSDTFTNHIIYAVSAFIVIGGWWLILSGIAALIDHGVAMVAALI